MPAFFDAHRRELLRNGSLIVAGLLLRKPASALAQKLPPSSPAAGRAGIPASPERAGASAAAPVAAATTKARAPRSLAFFNTHTDERIEAVYWSDGEYQTDALQGIDHILRDFRTGDVKEIDCGLLDLLHRLQGTLDTSTPFHVISGYRSPATNRRLQEHSTGVAAHSLHLEGRAIDIRVPGLALHDLRDAALTLKRGGVGYYPPSDFVHVDVGRPRSW